MSVLRRTEVWDISESEESGTEKQSNVAFDAKIANVSSNLTSTEHKRLPPAPVTDGPTPTGGPTTSSPARKRRSKEEIEADRQTDRQRKEARERQRTVRANEKEERRREQRRRREAADNMKTLRPENYLKSLTVCIDPGIPDCLHYKGLIIHQQWGLVVKIPVLLVHFMHKLVMTVTPWQCPEMFA